MFDEIRPEGSHVSSEEKKAKERARYQAKKAGKKAIDIATGQREPRGIIGRPKSVVNRVTEYGALFNKLNEEHTAKGFAPLKTAMEVLIEAMQSDVLELKDKARIAEKLATFESSRAPIISIEHVQNMVKDEESTVDDSLEDFLTALRKV